ncbi:GNAT domain protein [Kalmanozyma brasiliensis GHG001]|uniref:N-acetyltransferase domain-containing protein n=1 Tax=Kalmanozyma brasiliensis (strain GHG001) TaxID=1365824 RepID=V5EB25_KALBG|nr:GNAT domain protein [Kalmanozyma brasiliensis GHG001]EST07581.1 GNAT domain protein [Kalmanozyma brasiliensis GHG001]
MSALGSGDSADNIASSSQGNNANSDEITFEPYTGEHQMPSIIQLIEKELSEPYIVYTYRYFVNQWPSLCFLAFAGREAIGVIVCKLDRHLKGSRLMRGYIAMISVKYEYRGKGLGKRLVRRAVDEMVSKGAQEVVLETEADNQGALALYERLGFIREKRLHRFYLNGKDSFRLILPIPEKMQQPISPELEMPPPTGLVQPPYPSSSSEEPLAFAPSASYSAYTHDHIL